MDDTVSSSGLTHRERVDWIRALCFDSDEIVEQANMTPLVPTPITSNARAEGRFDKRDFAYNKKRAEYRCPARERAIWRYSSIEGALKTHTCWPSACPRSAIRSECTTGDYRRIRRWEHEEVLEQMQARLDRMPQAGILRRRTVEHVSGTFKACMGATHFLMKTRPKVPTEMSLHVLAYNLKRMLQLLGTQPLIAVMRA
jgi:transposase